jgi:hypothetical protein
MDFFERFFGKNSNPDPKDSRSSFSRSVVKIVCKPDEDGNVKCKKYTNSSSDPSNSNLEYTTEEFDYNDSHLTDIEKDILGSYGRLGMGFSMLDNMFNNIFRDIENFHSYRPDFETEYEPYHNPNEYSGNNMQNQYYKHFDQSTNPDTKIYDF